MNKPRRLNYWETAYESSRLVLFFFPFQLWLSELFGVDGSSSAASYRRVLSCFDLFFFKSPGRERETSRWTHTCLLVLAILQICPFNDRKKQEHTSRDSKEKILAVLLFLVGSIPKRKTKTNGSGTVFLIFSRERESRVIIIIITVITGAHWSFVPPLCLRWRRNKRRRRRCCALLWLCFTIRGDNESNQNLL